MYWATWRFSVVGPRVYSSRASTAAAPLPEPGTADRSLTAPHRPVAEPLVFLPAGHRVCEPITKMGGQPVWVARPQWPVSGSGEPLRFLGQFSLGSGAVGYLFVEGRADVGPTAGASAFVIQPGGRLPRAVRVCGMAEGPTVGLDHLPRRSIVPYGCAEAGAKPTGAGWRLVARLGRESLPEPVGPAGIGDAFVSSDGKEGRFLGSGAARQRPPTSLTP